jgi:hypothetical protein
MPSKPKRWFLGDEDELFKLHRYEAPDGSGSGLWIDLRYVKATQLFTRIRSNALGEESGSGLSRRKQLCRRQASCFRACRTSHRPYLSDTIQAFLAKNSRELGPQRSVEISRCRTVP